MATDLSSPVSLPWLVSRAEDIETMFYLCVEPSWEVNYVERAQSKLNDLELSLMPVILSLDMPRPGGREILHLHGAGGLASWEIKPSALPLCPLSK